MGVPCCRSRFHHLTFEKERDMALRRIETKGLGAPRMHPRVCLSDATCQALRSHASRNLPVLSLLPGFAWSVGD